MTRTHEQPSPAVTGQTSLYLVEMQELADGKLVPRQVVIDRRGPESEADELHRLRWLAFVPLARDRRFLTLAAYWRPAGIAYDLLTRHPCSFARNPVAAAAVTSRIEFGRSVYAEPSSLVDVPPGIDERARGLCHPYAALTREEVFERVASDNRRLIESSVEPGHCLDQPWTVAVEIRQTACWSEVSIRIREGGGVLHEKAVGPIRLVRPTADELARYALPAAAGKGGAL